jgi:hypothetical protein
MARAAPAQDHPSAARGATRLWRLLYGLIAAPCAWLAAQVLSATLAQEACFPHSEPLAAPLFPGLHLMQSAALVLAVAVCASGAVVAYRDWRRTRGEHQGGGQVLLDIGEGRSRFMALAGMMTSLGFLAGTLFSVPATLLVPAC